MAQNVTGKRAAFVAAILSGKSVATAAKSVGISRRTGIRWVKVPEVRAAIRDGSDAILQGVQGRLGAVLDLALDVVLAAVRGHTVTASERWGASLALRHVSGLLQFLELEERVADLERRKDGL